MRKSKKMSRVRAERILAWERVMRWQEAVFHTCWWTSIVLLVIANALTVAACLKWMKLVY